MMDIGKDLGKAYQDGYNTAKAEVAKEIFEEIENVLNNIGYFDEIDFKSLKKKYTGEKV